MSTSIVTAAPKMIVNINNTKFTSFIPSLFLLLSSGSSAMTVLT
jgi:hypothetical protein